MSTTKRTTVYHIYPTTSGFSPRIEDYALHGRGETWAIAATSIRQAYYLAYNDTWATDPDRPIGILAKSSKYEGGVQTVHGQRNVALPDHRAGVRAIRTWMRELTSSTQ